MPWFFIVIFPILLGSQVTVTIRAADEDHCNRVRTLMIRQLDDHRSNATVLPCERGPSNGR